jgi:two-component system, NarL family, response regulator DevR
MPKNSIFIISNHLMFQHGLESLLGHDSEVAIVGRAATIDQAVGELSRLRPDVVIIDSTSPITGLTSFILSVLSIGTNIKIISLNLHDNQLCIYQYDRQQSAGYDMVEWKVKDITDLIKAINYASTSSQTAAP